MNAVVDLLRELDLHHVAIIRQGDRVRLRTAAGPVPADLVARARALKPDLLRVVPDSGARPVVDFRLPDHGPNTWATAVGQPGESQDDLVADLRRRWPEVEVQP